MKLMIEYPKLCLKYWVDEIEDITSEKWIKTYD